MEMFREPAAELAPTFGVGDGRGLGLKYGGDLCAGRAREIVGEFRLRVRPYRQVIQRLLGLNRRVVEAEAEYPFTAVVEIVIIFPHVPFRRDCPSAAVVA